MKEEERFEIISKLGGEFFKSVLISNKRNPNQYISIKGKWISKETLQKISEAAKKILEESE